jgi:hypothetical protein
VETRRVALISYRTDSGRRVASGLLVDERSVLTTDHVAAGHGHRVECGGAVSEVAAVFRSGTLEVDLAVLRLSTPVPGVVRLGCARVDQSRAGEVRDCVAVGFPRWKAAAGQRPSAQVTGTVPTAEGLRSSGGSGLRPGFLTLVAGRIVGAPNVERGDFDASPWAGMSGAGVVAGDLIIGVVRSHNLAEGPQSLTVTPLTAIDLLPADRGRALWEALGVTDSSWLPVLPRGAPYAVNQPGRLRLPELPPGLVSREALVDRAVAAFLDRPEPIVALTGFGGVGKTTLARQILWRQELRARWPGGVLWLSIGQRPDLPGLIATACVDLTGAAVGALSVTDLAAWLRDDLARRRALLVLDDVWDGAAIEPLLSATSGIPRLITTRDDRWLDPWTAPPIEVGMLEQAEAYRLLAAGLGTGTEPAAEPAAELQRLIDRLGRWPLLMGLAVGYLRTRLRRGATAAVALAEMADRYEALGVTAFDDRRATDLDRQQDRSRAVRLTLEASMRLLGDPDRERYRALTVFPAGLPIPMDLVADVWAPQLDRYGTQDLLDQLVGLSLLGLDYGAREVQLHDVLRDYLAPPAADQAAAHRTLIDRWGSPYQLQDTYRVEWYSYHLRAAGDDQALYDLITPHWRDHVLAVTRSLSSVAGDVRRAAEQAAATHRLGEEVRCHLIRTRMMASSGAVPLAALSAFTRLGELDRALGYADLRPAEQRDDAVLQIVMALAPRDWREALTLAEGRLTNPVPLAMALGAVAEAAAGEHPAQAADLVTRAIATADAIADPGARGDAILSLIGPAASVDPDLAESLAGRAERCVGWGSFEVDTPADEAEQWRQLALGALVRALAAGDPARAASLAETITESFGRASALTALAAAATADTRAAQPDRADALIAEAAALARQQGFPGNTAVLLAQIAAVPSGQADAYAAEAATLASATTHSEFFGWVRTGDEVLEGPASVLAHSHPRLALDLAENIDPSGQAGTEVKARVLATIADAMAASDPSRARELLERALSLSQSAEHLHGDITAVAEIAADLAQVDIGGFRLLIGQARQMAGGLASQSVRSEALAEIAAAVIGVASAADTDLIELALQVSSQIELPHFKTEALAGIVRALAVTDVSRALAVADLIDDSDASQRTRAELLAELTDRLAATDIWAAARVAAGIDDWVLRSHRLVHLATLLAPRDLEGCWRLLSDVDLSRWYPPVEPLMALVSAVAAVDVTRAVALASTFRPYDGVDALARIARVDRTAAEAAVPRIAPAALQKMAMKQIAVEAAKAAATTDPDQALALARQIAGGARRATTLAAISAIMSDAGDGRAAEIAATAKQAADRHPDWDSRDIYAAVVPVLAPAEVSQAVDAALHLPGRGGLSDDPRARALGQIARTHPRQALKASDRIPEADERWQALARIAEVTGELDTRRTAAVVAAIDMPGSKDEAFAALVQADPMLALRVAYADAESRLEYLQGIAWLAPEMTDDLAEALLSWVGDAQEKERLRRAIVIASAKNAPQAVAQDRLRHLLPLVNGDPDETWPVVRALVATITEPDQAASMAAAICSAMAW